MKLEDIGFYTLSDYRAMNASPSSPLWRCELILTDKCNFKCPYCRGLRRDCSGNMPLSRAKEIIDIWADERLKNIRFSGGEPTLYPNLKELIKYSKKKEIERIAISTNGSRTFNYYKELWKLGVNDFSISLDACCSSFGEIMNGGIKNIWKKTINNIQSLSKLTYVTVGIVFTPDNIKQSKEIIEFAHNLGISDIRIISSAQYNKALKNLGSLNDNILNVHPILKYRVNNFRKFRNVRGIKKEDTNYCYLCLDDMAIAGDYHFPCIIYMREGGEPIGRVSKEMRKERYQWFLSHNAHKDQICQQNCLDVCIDYNNQVNSFQQLPENLNGNNFDWQTWRHGHPMELGLKCRHYCLISDIGKTAIRKYCIGYCNGEETLARPKKNNMALLILKDNKKFWFHIRKNEFKEIFPELNIN